MFTNHSYFLVKYVCGTALVNEDLGHHEILNHDGDDHEVVLVDKVNALEVSIGESYGRETSWWWYVD